MGRGHGGLSFSRHEVARAQAQLGVTLAAPRGGDNGSYVSVSEWTAMCEDFQRDAGGGEDAALHGVGLPELGVDDPTASDITGDKELEHLLQYPCD